MCASPNLLDPSRCPRRNSLPAVWENVTCVSIWWGHVVIYSIAYCRYSLCVYPNCFWNDFFICNGNMKMLYSIICSGMALRQWYIGSRSYCYWTPSLFHELKHVANKGPRLDDFHSVFSWIFFSFPFFASEKQNYLIYLIFLFLIKQFIIPFNNY